MTRDLLEKSKEQRAKSLQLNHVRDNPPNLSPHMWLDHILAASVLTSTGPHSNCPVTAGVGNRTESSLSGTATHHHTPGDVLLVGPRDLLVVVAPPWPHSLPLGSRTDHRSRSGGLEPQGFSEQTSAAV